MLPTAHGLGVKVEVPGRFRLVPSGLVLSSAIRFATITKKYSIYDRRNYAIVIELLKVS